MKNKKVATITPEQAVAELKKKYPNDAKIIDDKVIDARQAVKSVVATEAVKDVPVPEKPAKEKKPSVTLERIIFLQPLIESGQHTQAELVEKVVEKFPTLTKSTAQTFLTDSKNPKVQQVRQAGSSE